MIDNVDEDIAELWIHHNGVRPKQDEHHILRQNQLILSVPFDSFLDDIFINTVDDGRVRMKSL